MWRLFFIMLSLSSSSAHAGLFGPDNYDECILESMKGVTSDKAALLIEKSCRAEFPRKETRKNEDVDLPKDVLKNLDTRAKWKNRNENTIRIEIYNANKNWSINRLTVRVTDKKSGEYKDYEGITVDLRSSAYQFIFGVTPLKQGYVDIELFNVPKEWNWSIVSGEGSRFP